MGRACLRATMLSRNRRCTQKTRVSHGPTPPRRHPAPGPCSTTQIDDEARLSAGHDAHPEPTLYPEDTGLTRPHPAPAPPSARTVFDHANRRRVAPVSGPRCSAGTDAVPRRHGSHTAPAPPRRHPALGPCSTTQIDDGSRLSAGHDAQPEPTRYPEDTGLTRPHPAPAPPSARAGFDHANRRWVAPVCGPRCSAGTDAVPRRHGSHTAPPRPGTIRRQDRVRPRKSTMGRACLRATMLSRNRRCTQKTRVSHGPAPPRRHPALGPCSTTQIDDGSRLSAGHDAQPEPTLYPEDTGLTRPHPAPAPPSAGAVFDHANRRWVAPVCGPRCSAGTDAVPRRHGSHTAPPRPGATQRQDRVRPRKSTMGRACLRATMLSRNRRCTQKTRVSHGPTPPRRHPAPGPCSTTQIDDGLRLPAGHDAQPEPTLYPEDTGLTRPHPAPAPPSARTL